MARFAAVLGTVSLVLVLAGAASVAVRIARDARSLLGAVTTLTPTVRIAHATDASLSTDDAGVELRTVRRPSSPRGARAPSTPSSMPPEQTLVDAMIARVCPTASRLLAESHARCGCASSAPDLRVSLEEACATWVETVIGDRTWATVEPDDRQIARCLDRIAVARDACWTDQALDDCRDLTREPVEIGEPCGQAALLCRGGVCSGTCVPMAREGEAAIERFCPSGLVLDRNGLCLRPGREGDPCIAETCEVGLYCGAGLCQRPRRVGAPCDMTGDCEDGLRCGHDGTCEETAIWCDDDEECGWAYVCDVTWTSRCVPSPESTSEEECEDGTTVCGEGFWCEDENRGGRCAPALCDAGDLVGLFGT